MNLVEISVRISSPAAKCDVEVEAVEPHLLVGERAQADVHPLRLGVVAGDVLEGVEVEVGAELAVEDGEDVLVELGGDAGGVVVGGLEAGAVLDQVGAEQEVVAGAEQRRDPLEEGVALARVEVADRAAEEGDQPRAGRRAGSRSRCCSKSQTRPRTSRPGYSSTSSAAVRWVISSEMSTGT